MAKEKIKEYVTIAFSSLILAIAFNTTLLPLEIVIGGSTGLSIVANHFMGLPPAVVVFACYLSAFVCGLLFLGRKKVRKAVLGTVMFPLWIFATSPLCDYVKGITLNSEDYLVLVIVGAVISGIAYGLVYKLDCSTGGSDIAAQIINKYTGITIGTANTIFNSFIIIAGGAIFGWTEVLYAVLTLYIIGVVTDKVLLGISFNKAFYIITDKVDEVKEYIRKEFGKSITELEAVGGYTDQKRRILMYVIPTRNYFKLKQGINVIDEDAFFVIMDAYEMESKS